jgi:hypothetical protein
LIQSGNELSQALILLIRQGRKHLNPEINHLKSTHEILSTIEKKACPPAIHEQLPKIQGIFVTFLQELTTLIIRKNCGGNCPGKGFRKMHHISSFQMRAAG